jgi:hypothetical protein
VLKLVRYSLLLLTIVTLPACQEDKDLETSSTKNVSEVDSQTKPAQALLVFGGYTSCGINEENKISPLSIKAAMGSTLKIFTSLRNHLQQKGVKDLKLVLSCYFIDPEKTYFHHSALGSGPSLSMSPDDMIRNLDEVLGASGSAKPELHIIGHSYGGWTAMEFVRKLKDQYRIRTLITLDPISRHDCNPSLILEFFNTLKQPLEYDTQLVPQGCRQSPKDRNYPSATLAAMAEKVDRWVNYYQTTSRYISSSAIEVAENIDLSRRYSEETDAAKFNRDTVNSHAEFLWDETLINDMKKILDR